MGTQPPSIIFGTLPAINISSINNNTGKTESFNTFQFQQYIAIIDTKMVVRIMSRLTDMPKALAKLLDDLNVITNIQVASNKIKFIKGKKTWPFSETEV